MKTPKTKRPGPLQLAQCETVRLEKEIAALKAALETKEAHRREADRQLNYWQQCTHKAESAQRDLEYDTRTRREGRRWMGLIWTAMGVALGVMLTLYATVMLRPPTPLSVALPAPAAAAPAGPHCWDLDGRPWCADHITTSADLGDHVTGVAGWDNAGRLLWSVNGVHQIKAVS